MDDRQVKSVVKKLDLSEFGRRTCAAFWQVDMVSVLPHHLVALTMNLLISESDLRWHTGPIGTILLSRVSNVLSQKRFCNCGLISGRKSLENFFGVCPR